MEGTSLGNLNNLRCGFAFVCELVPFLLDLGISICPCWKEIVVIPHCVQQTVVNRTKIKNLSLLLQQVNKWQKQMTLQSILIQIFWRAI